MGVGGCDGKEIRQIAAQSVKRQGLAGAGAGGGTKTGFGMRGVIRALLGLIPVGRRESGEGSKFVG